MLSIGDTSNKTPFLKHISSSISEFQKVGMLNSSCPDIISEKSGHFGLRQKYDKNLNWLEFC